MAAPPTIRFAETARRLGGVAREARLVVPAFRCPPRLAGATRTIRRYPGGPVVAVRLRGRPFADVVADMIEGVIAANNLQGPAAAQARASLTGATRPESIEVATPDTRAA